MILLSPEEIDYQIDYVLDHNDLPLEVLLKPLVQSTVKEQAKNIYKWGNETCFEHGHGVYNKHNCFKCWQQLKKEIEQC